MPDAFCTGSSIMPQKKNPDVLELIRGKTGRVIGSLQTLLVLVKGLPLAYNRDLQEDKPPLFDAMDTAHQSVALAAAIVENMEWNRPGIEAKLELGFLDATTLMEQLIKFGTPMRSAHEAVGRLVREAIDAGRTLAELPAERFDALCRDTGERFVQHSGRVLRCKRFRAKGRRPPSAWPNSCNVGKKRLNLS